MRSPRTAPWRDGHRLELLADGERFFPAMLAAIDGAQEEILLEFYLVEPGVVLERFTEALERAGQRGVSVYLLVDGFGALRLSGPALQRLQRCPGLALRWFNPLRYHSLVHNLLRDHRKLLLVDRRIVFTGGTGLTDAFLGNPTRPAWRELMLRAEGPVAADWRTLFFSVWSIAAPSGQASAAALTTCPVWPLSSTRQAPDLPAGGRCRLAPGGPGQGQEMKRSLLLALRSSRQRAWIATAYFIPTWKFRRELRRAARRGVDVRLLLSGPITDHPAIRHAARRYYSALLRAGVRIFEYQPRFWHAKVTLCDERVSIGSSNLDRWNLRWNLEANLEIDDDALAREVADQLQGDLADCLEIDAQQWPKRPLAERLREWWWGRVELWLERLRTVR